MVAAAIVGSTVATVGAGLIGSSNAASAQENAANQANATQQAMFNTTQQNLNPYIQSGTQSTQTLNQLLGVGGQNPLSSPLLQAPQSPTAMTESQLQKTPGYQFNLSQGLESVQNSAAARGLGVSGAALKGAAAYATGLADSTYQNQFNNQQTLYQNAVTNQSNQFNRLMGLTSVGENAAAGLGNNAQQTGANIGNNLIGAGNAQGASYIAGANSISNGLSGGASSYLLSQSSLFNGGSNAGGYNPMTGASY